MLDRSSARSILLRQVHHGEARQLFHLNQRACRPGDSKVRGFVVSCSVFVHLSTSFNVWESVCQNSTFLDIKWSKMKKYLIFLNHLLII